MIAEIHPTIILVFFCCTHLGVFWAGCVIGRDVEKAQHDKTDE